MDPIRFEELFVKDRIFKEALQFSGKRHYRRMGYGG